MSATLSLPTPLAAPASLLFSTFMADDKKSLALGLRRRDPELLDRLIEQYQYRLFRYLRYITGNLEAAEDFFQETWILALEPGRPNARTSKFQPCPFSLSRHL